MEIGTIIYFLIGVLCSYHWFEEDYGQEYRNLKKKREVEDGMTVILLLFMTIFWLPIFLCKVYRAL